SSEHHLVLPRPWAAAAAAGSGTTQSGCVQRVHLPSDPTLVRRPSRMSSPPDATWPPRCPISSVLPTVGEGAPRDRRANQAPSCSPTATEDLGSRFGAGAGCGNAGG